MNIKDEIIKLINNGCIIPVKYINASQNNPIIDIIVPSDKTGYEDMFPYFIFCEQDFDDYDNNLYYCGEPNNELTISSVKFPISLENMEEIWHSKNNI